jgi:transposase
LEDAHIKLTSVVTESRGVSARAMLEARSAGERDAAARAAWARGRLRPKRDQLAAAWRGDSTPHHRCLVTEDLSQSDDLDEAIDRVRAAIAQHLVAAQEAVTRLAPMPGVSPRTAEILLADIGTDLTRFPTATPRASWAGRCPGPDDSGGKRLGGQTRTGHRRLRRACVAVAPGASNMQQTY